MATIQTTTVGSYPVPEWLSALPSEAAVMDATRVVFDTQRQAGIDLPTDGELYRFDVNHPDTNGMIEYFVHKLGGIDSRVGRADAAAFRAKHEMAFRSKPAAVVRGPITEGVLNLAEDCARAGKVAGGPFKFTLTSPYMLARTLLDKHYKTKQALVTAISDILAGQVAQIDADIVQVDEANLTGSPEDGPWVAEALNRIFGAVTGKAAIHLCFGNYGGQSIQKGHWGQLINFINALQIDHVVAEIAFRGQQELMHFRDLRPEIGLGLGVINVKSTIVETPDQVARAIDSAEKIVGKDRITYVHPDCGFWMLKRNIVDAKMAALVKGRDMFMGQQR